MVKKFVILFTFFVDTDIMNGMTAKEIGDALGIHQKAAKTRLRRAGIIPIGYAGPTAIYPQEAIEVIRNVSGKGRPRKNSSPK
jgi:predicted ArsR family transcriptional regulator